ncbi:MAG: hypothetical protein HY820_24820 [Acidobacteria bacterium]|nr:hypothetical protein [Acidobacteriota bacterium]
MVHHVKDLSAEQRRAIENLLGRTLLEEESLTIRPARMLKDAPVGEVRTRLFGQYRQDLDRLADRVKDVPEEELDAAVDEALRHIRRKGE